MQFTDKEIELAGYIKEAGLKWKPDVGDWYCSDRRIDLLVTLPASREQFVGYFVWLPLWHQCRQILTNNDLYILLLTKKDGGMQLDVWKHDGGHKTSRGKYIGMVHGETDLEAMYQAIRLYVLNQIVKEGIRK